MALNLETPTSAWPAPRLPVTPQSRVLRRGATAPRLSLLQWSTTSISRNRPACFPLSKTNITATVILEKEIPKGESNGNNRSCEDKMASFHLQNITAGEGEGGMLWRGISALRIYLDVSDRQHPAVLVPNYLEAEIRWGADCKALIWSGARLVSWYQSCHGLYRQPTLRSVPETHIHLRVSCIQWPPLIKRMSSPFCTQKESMW